MVKVDHVRSNDYQILLGPRKAPIQILGKLDLLFDVITQPNLEHRVKVICLGNKMCDAACVRTNGEVNSLQFSVPIILWPNSLGYDPTPFSTFLFLKNKKVPSDYG